MTLDNLERSDDDQFQQRQDVLPAPMLIASLRDSESSTLQAAS
ncbi:hypothetical protein [Paenibacillus thiaminolyticus]|nr:hypothetical protein [Paenibacillus thiaminolyticus]